MMYTSGCPKNQNRNCQSSGSEPSDVAKNVNPASRSKRSSTPATVRNGIASTSRNDVTSTLQVNRVMRENVMPGARSAKIVTIMFSAPKIDEKRGTVRLMSHRSWPWLGEYGSVESGTYEVPPDAGGPTSSAADRVVPPGGTSQDQRAFSFGE